MRKSLIESVIFMILSLTITGSCSQKQENTNPTKPVKLASLSDPCDDLTANIVLSKVKEEYNTTLDLPTPSKLNIKVSYDGGEIICHPARPAPPGTLAPDLPASLEIEVEVEFATIDSTFNEKFTAKLNGGTGLVNFSFTIEPQDIKGAYDPDLTDYENVKVSFSATFDGVNTWGTVAKTGHRPGKASEYIPVARWDNRK